jgi:uncharacterized protein (DUF58 family)
MRVVPGKLASWLLAGIGGAVLAALLAGVPVREVALGTTAAIALLAVLALLDAWRSRRAWRAATPELTRRLPPAFAIGVARGVPVALTVQGASDWRGEIYDHFDSTLGVVGLPAALTLPAGKRVELSYTVTPSRRGDVSFAPAELRLRSLWRLCELFVRVGATETRRVYPDFAQIARYAWLAGDRRLQEIGIKAFRQRGEGTDFKQLAEYRHGDAVRHIDWKASLRLDKPIVREFQDERDQCVMLLVDCGRRMRADDRHAGAGTAHFDQVLNAVMLLSYVALRQGDAVGALTFGTPAGSERLVAPRKGGHALAALMSELYGVQPTPSHSDYVAAAQDLLRRQGKRSLVIVITNFRDEDASELELALKLLRSRHLVLLASVRERIVGELLAQPLVSADAALDVASAHLYEQARRDAFLKLTARDALLVDAEPERLGVELVNRYHAVKRAGLI